MKTENDLYDYQRDKIIPHLLRNPYAMVWSFMGSGKTGCSLTAFTQLHQFGFVQRAIVFGPYRVAHTVWIDDAAEWQHLKHLRFARLTGGEKIRLRELFRTDVDIFLCNYEKIPWLVKTLRRFFVEAGRPLPFDLAIYDEITMCKNSASNRTRAWAGAYVGGRWMEGIRAMIPRHWGLTGTPLPNGMKDLHGQYLMLDGGERLGKGITQFKERFFWQVGQYRKLELKEGSRDKMMELISDMTLQLKEEDYSTLPPFRYVDMRIELPERLRQQYNALERDMFTQLDSGTDVEVFNKASVMNKCLQFASGSVYLIPGEQQSEDIHDLKLEVIDEILDEIGDKPLLVIYQFKTEKRRLLERYPYAECLSETTATQSDDMQRRWNEGKIKMLIGHPKSMGHGLNLQRGSNFLAAIGLTWSHEGWQQVIKRIHRTGQGERVTCFRILCKDTVDEAQVLALESKLADEAAFREALHQYKLKKGVL